MTTLNELRPGKTAVITGIEGTDAVAMRLMELGLFEGERISMQGMAPLGDPREYSVCGCRVSLRKSETQRVYIQPQG
ncbi:MAG: ferrous iron transport protein A [Planctomycetaceae bacterium]|nr:ferrous iron transport protein A [Planctomycetaceae bacterium]